MFIVHESIIVSGPTKLGISAQISYTCLENIALLAIFKIALYLWKKKVQEIGQILCADMPYLMLLIA